MQLQSSKLNKHISPQGLTYNYTILCRTIIIPSPSMIQHHSLLRPHNCMHTDLCVSVRVTESIIKFTNLVPSLNCAHSCLTHLEVESNAPGLYQWFIWKAINQSHKWSASPQPRNPHENLHLFCLLLLFLLPVWLGNQTNGFGMCWAETTFIKQKTVKQEFLSSPSFLSRQGVTNCKSSFNQLNTNLKHWL